MTSTVGPEGEWLHDVLMREYIRGTIDGALFGFFFVALVVVAIVGIALTETSNPTPPEQP